MVVPAPTLSPACLPPNFPRNPPTPDPHMPTTATILPADTNQALGLANFALDFLWNKPDQGGCEAAKSVLERTELFHTDACLCGVSALALGTNAPNILRDEALQYRAPPRAPARSARRTEPSGPAPPSSGPVPK